LEFLLAVANAFTYIALAAWLITFIGLLHRLVEVFFVKPPYQGAVH